MGLFNKLFFADTLISSFDILLDSAKINKYKIYHVYCKLICMFVS